MDLFISWSGDHSRQVAGALADWIPKVIQSVRPWVSDKDIHSGQRWQTEIIAQLEKCSFGIIVVTASNQSSPWLQFEAGALSKAVAQSRVVPLLVDLATSDLQLPLNMFQAETLGELGMKALMASINADVISPLPPAALDDSLKVWWPVLEPTLEKIKPAPQADKPPTRSDRDMLEELVTLVRGLRNTAMIARESDQVLSDVLAKRDEVTRRANAWSQIRAVMQQVLANPGHDQKATSIVRDTLATLGAEERAYLLGNALTEVLHNADQERPKFHISPEKMVVEFPHGTPTGTTSALMKQIRSLVGDLEVEFVVQGGACTQNDGSAS